jgi:hypothetical protein
MSWHRFPAGFGPFSTVFRRTRSDEKAGFAAILPFSPGAAPIKNGENGKNRQPSKPCHFVEASLI